MPTHASSFYARATGWGTSKRWKACRRSSLAIRPVCSQRKQLNAVSYEKLGMRQSADVMEKDKVHWTPFTVGTHE